MKNLLTPINSQRDWLKTTAQPDEELCQRLKAAGTGYYSVEVRPPRNRDLPATLDGLVRGIQEFQTKWFGLKNASPITAFEIRRIQPGQLRIQFAVPTKRLERRLRTHLANEIPGIQYDTGYHGVPVSEEESIGGGFLTLGRVGSFPLRTEFDEPPMNSVSTALHRHAMRDSKILLQILFRPWLGDPMNRWRWIHKSYQRIGYLRKEKHRLLPGHDRPATPRERSQADAIEQKAGTPLFRTTIRFLVIGAGEHTVSRIKEISGGFNVYESPATGQYLDTNTVKSLRTTPLLTFAEDVAARRFRSTVPFTVSSSELAGLVSIPDRDQRNIAYAEP